jgi:hypothetical protein
MDVDEIPVAGIVPQGEKKLRACMITGLIKSEDQARPLCNRARCRRTGVRTGAPRPAQWIREGNENLKHCLDFRDREIMMEVTSANYDGQAARPAAHQRDVPADRHVAPDAG